MAEGGCGCGAVRYRMIGPPIFVNCCHCRDCQKLGGSAFALNAMIEADRMEVIGAAEPIVDAEGMRRCPRCHTALWGLHPRFGDAILFLRAGTLDEAERLLPDAHFFVRSKHPWITLPAGTPAFETLPTDADPPLFGAGAQARLAAADGGLSRFVRPRDGTTLARNATCR